MMIQFTKEQTELYNRLKITKDKEEIQKIRSRLKEISAKRKEQLKNCPFAH